MIKLRHNLLDFPFRLWQQGDEDETRQSAEDTEVLELTKRKQGRKNGNAAEETDTLSLQ